jgi:hypothetical protein
MTIDLNRIAVLHRRRLVVALSVADLRELAELYELEHVLRTFQTPAP